jgi:hypothetical protein
MKTAFLSICLVIGVSSVALGQPSKLPCPSANGAYVRVGDDWKPMDASHSVGFKTTNVAGAAFSYGAASAKMKAQFRDAKSPYQLSANQLEVCLVGITDSGRDISFAKMQEEKNHRELPMASYRLWTGINAQLDPKNLLPVDVEKLGDKVYYIKTKGPLPTGEFILFTIVPDVAAMVKANNAGSLGGYDVGYHTN